MKPGNPIDPVSEFFFSFHHANLEIPIEAFAQLCRGFTGWEIRPPKPRALVLTAEEDPNGALNYGFGPFRSRASQSKAEALKEIERHYRVTYRRVNDQEAFCKAIREEAERVGPISLLWSNAHGGIECISLGADDSMSTGNGRKLCKDRIPIDCFRGLASDATVVLNSCSVGRGGTTCPNLANAIARATSPDVRIFASRKNHSFVYVVNTDPLVVKFYPKKQPGGLPGDDATYLVDHHARSKSLCQEALGWPSRFGPEFQSDQSIRADSRISGYEDEQAISSSGSSISSVPRIGLELAGRITGISEVIDTVTDVRALIAQPLEAPRTLFDRFLSNKEYHLRRLANLDFSSSTMNELLSVGTSALALMDLVSTAVDLFRTPEATLRSIVTAPYVVVKTALQNLRDLATHPKKAIPRLLKAFVQSPAQTVRRFFSAIGLRRRKKKKKRGGLDPAEMARRWNHFNDGVVESYGLAQSKWLLVPGRTFEDYHADVLHDALLWNTSDYHLFPSLLTDFLRKDLYQTVHRMSSRAHPPYTLAPPEVVLATHETVVFTNRLVQAVDEMLVVEHCHQKITIQTVIQVDSVERKVKTLSELVRNNRDKLRAKLRK